MRGHRARRFARPALTLAIGLILVWAAAPAEGTTPGQGPALGVADSSGWIRAKKLSDIAGWIKLRNPAGSEDQAIVISDHNIATVARSGAVSFGTSAGQAQTPGEPRPAWTAPGAPAGEDKVDWREEYREQRSRVADLESQLEDYDSWRSARRNPYAGPRIASRDPTEARRESMARELEAEQRKLSDLRRNARREGVYLRR